MSKHIDAQMARTDHKKMWPADGSVPPHVQQFIEWLVTPRQDREPDEQTQTAWGRKYGYAKETVSTWKREPRVRAALEKRCDELNISMDRIQNVVNALYKQAEAGDVKSAQLYLQYVDRLAPKRIVVEDRRLSEMSDEELRRELQATGLLSEATNED